MHLSFESADFVIIFFDSYKNMRWFDLGLCSIVYSVNKNATPTPVSIFVYKFLKNVKKKSCIYALYAVYTCKKCAQNCKLTTRSFVTC